MGVRLFQVDAFADRAFSGNPAAVCLLEAFPEDAWMQNLAAEMNLSETAFVVPSDDGFGLRWFTPAMEVDLCGHATLASAHVLWTTGRLDIQSKARFHTTSGLLTSWLEGHSIVMDFPAEPALQTDSPAGLLEALGTQATWVGANRMDVLVEVESEQVLRRLEPDFALLSSIDVRGVIVTARSSTTPFDFVSRFFAPAAGVDEDPVTGSAHCCLGPYWSERLGQTELKAFQASRRGGTVEVSMLKERVLLKGQAVTVFEARLNEETLFPKDTEILAGR